MRIFTEDALDCALKETAPLIVAFTAPWCSASRRLASALQRLEVRGGVTVGIVEVDEEPAIPARFGVRGLPTTMLFRDGTVAATRIGALSERQVEDWVDGLV